jgi:hypothetical protein
MTGPLSMYLIAILLLARRHAMKVGELSFETVGWLFGGGIGLLVVWIIAERLAVVMPARLHCNVCGERLKGLEIANNLRPAEPLSYPFRLLDGTRTEQPVQALCRKCTRRARRHRASGLPDA